MWRAPSLAHIEQPHMPCCHIVLQLCCKITVVCLSNGPLPPPPPLRGRHGQKLHSGFPPRQVDARSSADARSSTDACLSWQKVQGREANRRRHRLTEQGPKALCQPPPLSHHMRAAQGAKMLRCWVASPW